ncbi:MAG: cob(I)yrinic acid a,c-diamide adenosyltransferase [Veillonella sp.]|uniref:cob(I)yrinic acid a,c-diamide adenosyltransferase n=1 Tax=Veillonella sp. TaxID=1926307 RepID=UPI0025D6A2B7|nr:cob(I)yrinic acid a,c-diamide adenosyltransferase [Veillonella sp.]MBS4913687.1 cob(I)yrinic acid a,c-diamide adenosyltransferase [Veillonella sp.]
MATEHTEHTDNQTHESSSNRPADVSNKSTANASNHSTADLPKGLILVNTGNGKGKTTAALGTAMRAVGQGLRVLILQFIKGAMNYGELTCIEALNKAGLPIEIRQMGKGFVYHKQKSTPEEIKAHEEAAAEGWRMVEREVQSGNWDLIVLDEINYAIGFELVDAEKVVQLLKDKPKDLHMILTGRNARPEIIELAHTVTSMEPVKHAYEQGIKAARGIEF